MANPILEDSWFVDWSVLGGLRCIVIVLLAFISSSVITKFKSPVNLTDF